MRTMSWILNVGTFQAVRRIPINTISLTGEVLGQEFESSLERDLIMLMAWHYDSNGFKSSPSKLVIPTNSVLFESIRPICWCTSTGDQVRSEWIESQSSAK